MVECVAPPAVAEFLLGLERLSVDCQLILEGAVEVNTFSLFSYLGLFFLTCVIEGPIYWLGTRRQLPLTRILFLIFFVNLLTHPLVTWVFPLLAIQIHASYGSYVIFSEIFAPLIEALALHFQFRLSWKRSFLVSIAANLGSWWLGPFIFQWLAAHFWRF